MGSDSSGGGGGSGDYGTRDDPRQGRGYNTDYSQHPGYSGNNQGGGDSGQAVVDAVNAEKAAEEARQKSAIYGTLGTILGGLFLGIPGAMAGGGLGSYFGGSTPQNAVGSAIGSGIGGLMGPLGSMAGGGVGGYIGDKLAGSPNATSYGSQAISSAMDFLGSGDGATFSIGEQSRDFPTSDGSDHIAATAGEALKDATLPSVAVSANADKPRQNGIPTDSFINVTSGAEPVSYDYGYTNDISVVPFGTSPMLPVQNSNPQFYGPTGIMSVT